MAHVVHFGTMVKDYEEYTDFDEEPQAHTYHEKIPSFSSSGNGFFRAAIPIMPLTLSILCCIINFLIPGSGEIPPNVERTMLAGISVLCCSDSRGTSRLKCFYINMLAAILQLISSPLLIGIVWSSVWGVMFIQVARNWYISDLDHRADCLTCCPCSTW